MLEMCKQVHYLVTLGLDCGQSIGGADPILSAAVKSVVSDPCFASSPCLVLNHQKFLTREGV